ncbi:DUF5617 domain-containing protein [Legionella jordanis]|uniref:Leucine-rich repeat protein n=1 Tax=Legionella jordanis TaxID=456 RepID=A0A0W0V7R3_9GAMM|nr:DUF5617 domain-containing protein [Legionella jordanis]KTD16177.1 Leucine-rich repeat protein [Legionella jordanis]RMX04600.1 hypothetical protein EAW55_03965 [Legionella jordanis]VEH12365.1 Leucine-rich repeat protein [Legionella jordanis]
MKFYIDELQEKSLDEIRAIFLSIPKTGTQIELIGCFEKSRLSEYFEYPIVAKALSYLPKHIYQVVFTAHCVYTNHSRQVETSREWSQRMHGYVVNYRTEGYKVRHIGSLLQYYIASLPKTVNEVILDFVTDPLYDNTPNLGNATSSSFKNILKKFPESVTFLSVDFSILDQVSEVEAFRAIPKSVIKLHARGFWYDSLNVLGRNIKILNLSHKELNLTQTKFSQLFKGLSEILTTLGLAFHDLGRKSPLELSALLSGLPQGLQVLSLQNNNLARLGAMNLSSVLSTLSPKIYEIDLGENNLLLMATDELTTALSGLPETVKSLRIWDKNPSGFLITDLLSRFHSIPSHIEELSFRDSNFVGFPIAEFSEALIYLPDFIIAVDFSDNKLHQKPPKEVALLLSKLRANVKTVRLKGNNLSSLSVDAFKEVFSTLPEHILELDISENGFDRLTSVHLNQYLGAIPSTVKRIILDGNKFTIKNDGTLIARPLVQHQSLFKTIDNFKYQKQFASLRLVLMQWTGLMLSFNFDLFMVANILFYVFNDSRTETMNMAGQLAVTLVSSKPPKEITTSVQQASLQVARERINALTRNETKLDLSRCGLNRLDNFKIFRNLFKEIPISVTSLNLRGNGFHYDERTKKLLIVALQFIPEHVVYLDLSAHGFEHYSAEELKALFINLPATVELVSLADETPLSPAQQIAKRAWPDTYQTLTMDAPSFMHRARLLLDDYTKGGSWMQRFFSGHWNRHHAEEVGKILMQIDKGFITNADELFAELEQIPLSNEAGSLARRLSFLLKTAFTPKLMIEENDTEDMEMKMITYS